MKRSGRKSEKARQSLVFYNPGVPVDPPVAADCPGNCGCMDERLNEASTAAYYVGSA